MPYPFGYPVEIRHLFVSPGHNYFGHAEESAGEHPIMDVPEAKVVAGMGIEGDRFFNFQQHYEGQVTFFAWEVYEALRKTLQIEDRTPEVFRRNVVISGVPVTALIGHEFAVGDVVFRGTKHCAPCSWMDRAFGEGALKLLRGRGGLRARVLETGVLKRGPATLESSVELDPEEAAMALTGPMLP